MVVYKDGSSIQARAEKLRPDEVTGFSVLVKRAGQGDRFRGKRVAIITANEFEDIQLLYPLLRLSEEAAEVVMVPIIRGSHPINPIME